MDEAKLSLEKVIGCTTIANSCLASSPSGDVFHAAGAVIVRYNPHSNKQLGFFHTSGKPVACLCISADGAYLACGERGHQPRVLIWDIASGAQLAALTGHRQGVGCIAFSPDGRHLVSVGFKYDRQVLLWDWRRKQPPTSGGDKQGSAPGAPLCVCRLSNKVNAVCWSECGTFFVTCGDRHLKFWTLEYPATSSNPNPNPNPSTSLDNAHSAAGDTQAAPTGLSGKPGSITEHLRDAVFMDVCCGAAGTSSEGMIYCTTSAGVLCAFTQQRLMDKWVQLESPASYCLALFCKPQTAGLLVVGCADGIIRAFSPDTLIYHATLPLPCPLLSSADTLSYAACYALCKVAPTATQPVPKLCAVYADHSLFVWDIADIMQVAHYRSFVAHRACIWDVHFIDQPPAAAELLPPPPPAGNSSNSALPLPPPPPATSTKPPLPPGSFASCSADGTVRIWNIDPRQQQHSRWKSLYSRDLLHTLEIQDDAAPSAAAAAIDRPDVSSSLASISSIGSHSQHSGTMAPSPFGVDLSCGLPDPELPGRQPPAEAVNPRALAVHPSGRQIAVGDRTGRLRVFDLGTMAAVHSTQAHCAEILTCHYSPALFRGPQGDWTTQVGEDETGEEPMVLLATAGRDRLVHIFACVGGIYSPLTTLDHHSSSITIVKFTSDGRRLVTCGGDRTMVLCSVNGPNIARLKSIPTPHGTVNGVAVEATNKFCVTSGQDRRLNIWNLHSGKHLRAYKHAALTHELYKADIDPSGMYVAASAFDRSIFLFDFFSGELVAQV